MNLKIPKHHPDLPYSMNVMLRDIRSYLARKLWRERQKRRGLERALKFIEKGKANDNK